MLLVFFRCNITFQFIDQRKHHPKKQTKKNEKILKGDSQVFDFCLSSRYFE
jgi:hypothetical protein